jgi:hypothetical protein
VTRYVISLSAIPPRFAHLGPVLDSLLRQRPRAEAVLLYIPKSYRRFPEWDGALPDVPEGVEIRRVEEDLGPATKLCLRFGSLKDRRLISCFVTMI